MARQRLTITQGCTSQNLRGSPPCVRRQRTDKSTFDPHESGPHEVGSRRLADLPDEWIWVVQDCPSPIDPYDHRRERAAPMILPTPFPAMSCGRRALRYPATPCREPDHDPRDRPCRPAAERRRSRARHGDYGRRAEARAYALGNRGPTGSAPTASSRPRSWSPTGLTASMSSRASSGPPSWASCAPTSTPSWPRADSARRRRSIARPADSRRRIIKPPYKWARPLSDPLGGTTANNGRHPAAMLQPEPDADGAGVDRRAARRQPSPQRRLPAPLWPSRSARRRGVDPGRRLRALQRSDLREGAGPRSVGRLAPGRHDALERRRLGPRRPRLQLHDPALSQHGGERRLGAARQPPARQGRHQADGRRVRIGSHRGRSADAVRRRRRDRDQPPAGARLLRQHSPDRRITLNEGFFPRRACWASRRGA